MLIMFFFFLGLFLQGIVFVYGNAHVNISCSCNVEEDRSSLETVNERVPRPLEGAVLELFVTTSFPSNHILNNIITTSTTTATTSKPI